MVSLLWKIVRVALAALATLFGSAAAVSIVCIPQWPLYLFLQIIPYLISAIPSVLMVGVPAYLLAEHCRIRWRRTIATGVAIALSAAAAWLSMPVMHQCLFSYDARLGLAKRLNPEEARTIRCLPTEGDESCFCPHWFQFQRDGRVIGVGAMEDIIHGTKYQFDGSP